MELLEIVSTVCIFGIVTLLNVSAKCTYHECEHIICVCDNDNNNIDNTNIDITENNDCYDTTSNDNVNITTDIDTDTISSVTTVTGVCNNNNHNIITDNCDDYDNMKMNVIMKEIKLLRKDLKNIKCSDLSTSITSTSSNSTISNNLSCKCISCERLYECSTCYEYTMTCDDTCSSNDWSKSNCCTSCYKCCDDCRDSVSMISMIDCDSYNTDYTNTSCATIPFKPELKLDKCIRNSNSILLNNFCNINVTFLKRANIQVTIIGGGGAGGIGFAMSTYYIYGSGGSSGGCKVKMIEVEKNEKWIVNIGSGGNALNGTHGSDTVIESRIKNQCGTDYDSKFKLVGKGGMNGRPYLCEVKKTLYKYMSTHDIPSDVDLSDLLKGGCIDFQNPIHDECCEVVVDCDLNYKCGEDGGLGLPSQCATTGSGGSTHFTGLKGDGGNRYNKTGSNGTSGSGGGGSMPSITKNICLDDHTDRLSGNGGNGYVLLTLLDLTCESISDVIKIQTY